MEDFGYSKKEKQDDNFGFAKKFFLITASLFSVACFIYVTINAYNFIYSDNKNVETIESPKEPIKIIEEEKTNSDTEMSVNRSVYEDIFGNKKESLKKATPKLRDVVQPAIPPQVKSVTAREAATKEVVVDNKNKTIAENTATKEEKKDSKIVVYSNEKKEPQKQDLLEQKNVKKATTKTGKKSGIKVQIAAMTSKKSAEDYWEKLNRSDSRVFSGLDSFIEEVDLGKRGMFYRLQIGIFFNQVEADKFCDKYITRLRKTRADCIVVE